MSKPLFRGNQLKVRVLRRHFNQATKNGELSLQQAFLNNFNCPIACALKEKFPNVGNINVGSYEVCFDGVWHNMSNAGSETVYKNKPFTITLRKD